MRPLLLLIALLSPCLDEPKPATDDRDKIVGTWENVQRRYDGEDVDPSKDRMIITKGLMKSDTGAIGTTYVYTLDPSADPKRIEMWPERESGTTGKPDHGIYKLEEDRLTICINPFKDGRRPKKISAEKGEPYILLQRVAHALHTPERRKPCVSGRNV